jgi:hypothetical protein
VPFICSVCGNAHDGLPDVAFRWPDPYFGIPEAERSTRVKGSEDLCSIDEEDFFVRGVIVVPVSEQDAGWGIGAWVSLKQENFDTYRNNYNTSEIGPFFGWLCNRLPFYEEETWALKTTVHFQGNNQRPLIEIQEADHPLYSDFSCGVSLERAWQLVHTYQAWRSGT